MESINTNKIDIENGDKPDSLVNTEKLFGVKCPFSVAAFSKTNEYVPTIDKNYKFNPETTLSILAGFAHNRRVIIQGYHGTG